MQVKIFCNNAGVNQTPGWKTCIEIDAVSFLKQQWICSMEIWYKHQISESLNITARGSGWIGGGAQ